MLLKMGAAIDVGSSRSGWSPLTLAAWMGNALAVACLLEQGADPDHDGGGSCDGWSPLVAAATAGFGQICQQLLEQGASLALAKQALKSGSVPCCRQDAALRVLGDADRAGKGLSPEGLDVQSASKCLCDLCTQRTGCVADLYNSWDW
jgi:ankyrin repeat protein